MKKLPFIKTSDEGVANILRKEGFIELNKEGILYVFVNDKDITKFSEIPLNKCMFSNRTYL